ncbi:TPA: hypothetical protein GF676_23880 [Escherichia coli]|uniref:F4 family fimbrial subunit n=2 Tax=Escherichia coli TaxID=562 RepID=UPI000B42823C|nr:hypothetical protein [Escherichia coli]EEZ6327933.1 hypothetical protein [Escherichia coli]OWD96072.1 hypothetical protein A8M44_23800 [Escherichia coli]HAH2689300.1 hypothetical protein [Escherichia coli]HAI0782826.1 hypothetical protein [Escherichia coli]HAM6913569.1 hypothetical protein [Escherichia coli]
MKKTLIALAVAASAAVSGSAMAWTEGGTGGSINLGGTLTPVVKSVPWHVNTGAAVNDLNASLDKGQKSVAFNVSKAIPVLGMRTADKTAFRGSAGLTPAINYNGALDTAKFSANKAPLTLDILDAGGTKIGQLKTKLTAAGVGSRLFDSGYKDAAMLYAKDSWNAFMGGLSTTVDGVDVSGGTSLINTLFSGAEENFILQGASLNGDAPMATHFGSDTIMYSGAYASAISAQEGVTITLDQPAGADSIVWKASLPVTVSYQ